MEKEIKGMVISFVDDTNKIINIIKGKDKFRMGRKKCNSLLQKQMQYY